MRTYLRLTLVIAGVVALYLVWVFASRWEAGQRWTAVVRTPPVDMSTDVRITQFYAPMPSITEGGKTVVCYGVANADSVRLDPPVAAVSPSFNRCVAVQPERTTRYTLTALGKGGKSVSASFELVVTIDPETLPKITALSVCDVQRDRDHRYAHRICFKTENAVEIQVEPPVFAPFRGVNGQFVVMPEQTTTYTLLAIDRKGRSTRKSITIEVPHGGDSGKKTPLRLATFTP